MNRDDVLKVDELKDALTTSFRTFEHSLRTVFGELVYAVDTVVERYNDLDAANHQLEAKVDALQTRLDGEIAMIKRAMNLGTN